jgi:hypothetical protein
VLGAQQMSDFKHIIEPERIGLWVAVTFIIALLALGSSAVALKRIYESTVISQAEALVLFHRVQALEQGKALGKAEPATENKTN